MVHGSAREVRPLAKPSLLPSAEPAESREGRERSAGAGRYRSLRRRFPSMRNLLEESSSAPKKPIHGVGRITQIAAGSRLDHTDLVRLQRATTEEFLKFLSGSCVSKERTKRTLAV